MKNPDFLLNSTDPWVVYRSLIDLIGLDEADSKVIKAKEQMLEHPLIKGLAEELDKWPGVVLNSHKSAGQLYHKLSFVAELGIKKDDIEFPNLLKNITKYRSDEGLFQLPVNISESHGGTGKEQGAWALCDAPLLMYSIAKMGILDKNELQNGLNYLVQLCRDNGWPCAVSKELGNFRGPGRKGDPCPYANLAMLKLLTLFDEYRDSMEAHIGVECLLNLWENSMEQHPYIFYMGNDFRKLKVPFVWYDIMHVVEVLSQYDFARKDSRFLDMLEVINSKEDVNGLFTPESVWAAWKGWDFAQKKQPSAWLTFLVYRINKRL